MSRTSLFLSLSFVLVSLSSFSGSLSCHSLSPVPGPELSIIWLCLDEFSRDFKLFPRTHSLVALQEVLHTFFLKKIDFCYSVLYFSSKLFLMFRSYRKTRSWILFTTDDLFPFFISGTPPECFCQSGNGCGIFHSSSMNVL